jgi:biotin operon repressor
MLDNVKAPALQWYPKDALDIKVTRMSNAAQGVYWRLLWNIWAHTKTQFSIENCEKSLKKILGLSSVKYKKYMSEIQRKGDPIFEEKEGYLISKRLKIEKLKQIAWRKKSSVGGKKSAAMRSRVVQPPCQPKVNPSSSSSSSSPKKVCQDRNYLTDVIKINMTKDEKINLLNTLCVFMQERGWCEDVKLCGSIVKKVNKKVSKIDNIKNNYTYFKKSIKTFINEEADEINEKVKKVRNK